MLPSFIDFLYQNAASSGVVATYSIAEFISFVALTTVIFGLVFELPLFIIILVRSRLVERDLLVHYRFDVYIGLLILSALISTGPFVPVVLSGHLMRYRFVVALAALIHHRIASEVLSVPSIFLIRFIYGSNGSISSMM